MKTNELSMLSELRVYAAQHYIDLSAQERSHYTQLLNDTTTVVVISITKNGLEEHFPPVQELRDAFYRKIANLTRIGTCLFVHSGRITLLDRDGLSALATELGIARYTSINKSLRQFIQERDDELKREYYAQRQEHKRERARNELFAECQGVKTRKKCSTNTNTRPLRKYSKFRKRRKSEI